MNKWLPWLALVIAATWIGSTLIPPRDKQDQWAVQDFGRLPSVANGRFQPLDSLARNSLLQLREKQSIYLKDEKRTLPASDLQALAKAAPLLPTWLAQQVSQSFAHV